MHFISEKRFTSERRDELYARFWPPLYCRTNEISPHEACEGVLRWLYTELYRDLREYLAKMLWESLWCNSAEVLGTFII